MRSESSSTTYMRINFQPRTLRVTGECRMIEMRKSAHVGSLKTCVMVSALVTATGMATGKAIGTVTGAVTVMVTGTVMVTVTAIGTGMVLVTVMMRRPAIVEDLGNVVGNDDR